MWGLGFVGVGAGGYLYYEGNKIRITDPFNAKIDRDISVDIEEELPTLKHDFEVKPLFKRSYQDFWLTTAVQKKYPCLSERIQILFIAFPTSYLVERGFGAVARLLTK